MSTPAEFLPNTEGTWFDLPEHVYRAAPGIAQSTLKAANTPAHYQALLAEPFEETDALVFGRLFDARVFDTTAFIQMVIPRPAGLNLTTKDGKAWLEGLGSPSKTIDGPSGFRLLEDGRVIAGSRILERIHGMAEALRKHPDARAALHQANCQVSVFKRDDKTGLLMKGRLDALKSDLRELTTVIDLKSCEDASDEPVRRTIANYGYDDQASWYQDLVGATYHLLIMVEKYPPFGVRVINMGKESIDAARERMRRRLDEVAECERTGVWPCYPTGIVTINVKEWRLRQGGVV